MVIILIGGTIGFVLVFYLFEVAERYFNARIRGGKTDKGATGEGANGGAGHGDIDVDP